MKHHEKTNRNRTAGSISRLMRSAMQANAILIGLFWFQQPALSQVVKEVVVMDSRHLIVQPLTDWRSLQIGDTIRLKEGNKLAWYRIECVGKESSKLKTIMRRKIADGDTISIVKK